MKHKQNPKSTFIERKKKESNYSKLIKSMQQASSRTANARAHFDHIPYGFEDRRYEDFDPTLGAEKEEE